VVGQQGSKIHKHNYSTFKVCYPEELQSDELGERLEQLIKAGQDTGKQSTGLINQAMQQGLNVLLGTVLEE